MTSKELLYVEDALGHAEFFQTKCKETIRQLQDPELKSFVRQMQQHHANSYQHFYTLLEK